MNNNIILEGEEYRPANTLPAEARGWARILVYQAGNTAFWQVGEHRIYTTYWFKETEDNHAVER